METIEVGAIKVHLEGHDEAMKFLTSLMRPLSNKEIAAMIGISERTVARWKINGRLPSRVNGQLYLVDLLKHLIPEGGNLEGLKHLEV